MQATHIFVLTITQENIEKGSHSDKVETEVELKVKVAIKVAIDAIR